MKKCKVLKPYPAVYTHCKMSVYFVPFATYLDKSRNILFKVEQNRITTQ